MIIEIRNPSNPIIKIPIAETLDICWNSSFVGFFNVCQTLLHFNKNDFNAIANIDWRGF